MAILILPNQTIADEIFATPDIEGGIGSVMLGAPIELADDRLAYIHPWNEVTEDWLSGYTAGIAGAEVVEGNILPYAVKETEF